MTALMTRATRACKTDGNHFVLEIFSFFSQAPMYPQDSIQALRLKLEQRLKELEGEILTTKSQKLSKKYHIRK